jgi:hypothetical protein
MDVDFALIAERLGLKLPFLRFEKNDRRATHEFLEKIISVAPVCFQSKSDDDYVHSGCANIEEHKKPARDVGQSRFLQSRRNYFRGERTDRLL